VSTSPSTPLRGNASGEDRTVKIGDEFYVSESEAVADDGELVPRTSSYSCGVA
jgi:hypothetical protein